MDGFPRTQAQKHRHWQESGITADCFVFLDVPDEVLEELVRFGVGRGTESVTWGNFFLLEQFHANAEAVKALGQKIVL